MSRRANVERHGLNHTPGGSDPIPGTGCCPDMTPCTPFPEKILEVASGHATGALLGWWRLGEASAPFADSNPDLSHIDLAVTSGTNALTPDQPGGLTDEDDGAVMFNGWGNTAVGGTSGDFLHTSSLTNRFDFAASSATYAVTVWVKPVSHSATGYYASTGIVHSMVSGSINEDGWAIELAYPTGVLSYRRRQNGNGSEMYVDTTIDLDEWTFVAMVYDGVTDGGSAKLYVNGALADTTAGSYTTDGSAQGIEVGRNTTFSLGGGTGHNYYYGLVDELAIWGVPLSASEVSSLYEAGLPCTSGFEPGKVITVNDAGTATEWAFPTVAVEGTRYDEILAGTNVTATDNLDDTVTFSTRGVGDATLWDAKGDLAAGTGPDTAARLAVGTNGQVLVADSTQTTGLRWATGSFDPSTQTAGWMPLTTVVGGTPELVWSGTDNLIPTYGPF